MMDWTTHPGMNNLDPLKREIIRTAAKQVQGNSGNQMATVMMALITSARQHHITFSPEDTSLILDTLQDGKSPDDQ